MRASLWDLNTPRSKSSYSFFYATSLPSRNLLKAYQKQGSAHNGAEFLWPLHQRWYEIVASKHMRSDDMAPLSIQQHGRVFVWESTQNVVKALVICSARRCIPGLQTRLWEDSKKRLGDCRTKKPEGFHNPSESIHSRVISRTISRMTLAANTNVIPMHVFPKRLSSTVWAYIFVMNPTKHIQQNLNLRNYKLSQCF